MRNIHKAFTLAEVLIALAVVGVVAALVIPSLMSDMQKKIAVGTLGKATEQVQNGCQNMIQFRNEEIDGVGYYDKIASADPTFESHIAGYIGAKPENGANQILRTYSNNGQANPAAWNAANRYRFSKFNAEVGFARRNGGDLTKLDTKVADVYINVNPGTDTEPRLGRDVFLYEMDNSCRLIPVGLANPDACPNDGGTNCAARIVRDEYRITY